MKKDNKIVFKGVMRYLTLRNLLIAAFVFLIYLMFSNLAKAIIFTIIFVPVGTLSIKATRLIPHGNVEVISPLAVFLGYLYGWPVGAFYGAILGAYMWASAYSISQFVILHLALNIIGAFAAQKFAATMTFGTAYFLSMAIRDALFFVVGGIMGTPVENALQTGMSVVIHFVLAPSFMFLLYNLATLI